MIRQLTLLVVIVQVLCITTSSTVPTTSQASTSTNTASPSNTMTMGSSLLCPSANNTYYVSGGYPFLISCGMDGSGTVLASKNVTNLEECIRWCDNTDKCLGGSLYASTNLTSCYLRNSESITQSNITVVTTFVLTKIPRQLAGEFLLYLTQNYFFVPVMTKDSAVL